MVEKKNTNSFIDVEEHWEEFFELSKESGLFDKLVEEVEEQIEKGFVSDLSELFKE